jgi:hypothetical protein
MPTYTFKNKKTGKVWDDEMSYTQLDAYYKKHNCDQILGVSNTISGTGDVYSKTNEGFKDRMREIKKMAGKNSTIDV